MRRIGDFLPATQHRTTPTARQGAVARAGHGRVSPLGHVDITVYAQPQQEPTVTDPNQGALIALIKVARSQILQRANVALPGSMGSTQLWIRYRQAESAALQRGGTGDWAGALTQFQSAYTALLSAAPTGDAEPIGRGEHQGVSGVRGDANEASNVASDFYGILQRAGTSMKAGDLADASSMVMRAKGLLWRLGPAEVGPGTAAYQAIAAQVAGAPAKGIGDGNCVYHRSQVQGVYGAPMDYRGSGVRDLDPSVELPLQAYMAQWVAAINGGDAATASAALMAASNLADSLSSDPSAARSTASILGAIASDAGQLGQQAAQGDLSFAGSDTLAHLNGNINLLVTSTGSAGAAAYVAGTNVSAAASMQARAGIAAQQAGLQQQIAAFQPGGRWDPSEILGVSAAAMAPLQSSWIQINNLMNNSSLTSDDYAALSATQAAMARVLGVKAAASSAAGGGFQSLDDMFTKTGSCFQVLMSGGSFGDFWNGCLTDSMRTALTLAGIGTVGLVGYGAYRAVRA